MMFCESMLVLADSLVIANVIAELASNNSAYINRPFSEGSFNLLFRLIDLF